MKQKICLNGHQISSGVEPNIITNEFCEKCGEKVISTCPKCKTDIFGYDKDNELYAITGGVKVPQYCKQCGAPYPWTEAALKSARALIKLSDLDQKEKEDFNDVVPDLISDTPKTKVAAVKANRYLAKTGAFIGNALKDLLVDIASETAVKAMHL